MSVLGPIFCDSEDVPNRYNGAGVAIGGWLLLPAVPTTPSPPAELGSDLAGDAAPRPLTENSELDEEDAMDDDADGGGCGGDLTLGG